MTKLCFSGICGSGMSPLAQLMKLRGNDIIGTDRAFETDPNGVAFMRKAYEDMGIKIMPQNGSAITKDVNTLYISTAVEDTSPEIVKAKELDIPIITRPTLLAQVFEEYKHGIAIGGTSGKTTTTAMVGYILNELGKKPCMINGGLLKNYENQKILPNLIYNESDICVIEADESNGTIQDYNPYITLINNISVDHKPLPEIVEIFTNVSKKARYGLILNADCEHTKKLANPNIKNIFFSIKDKTADFYAYDIKPLVDGVEYKIANKTFKLPIIGDFNVANAIAAIAVCSLVGVDQFDAAKVLENFQGTKRRLEIIGSKNDITVINDFSHNPEKVKAAIQALKAHQGRLIIMYQPHGFASQKLYGNQIIDSFAETLNNDDIVLIPDIYYIGGTADNSIHSTEAVEHGKKLGLNIHYTETKMGAKNHIIQNARPGDRIIIMGARDYGLENLCKEILKEL